MGFKPITVNTAPEDAEYIYAQDDAAIYQSIFESDGVFNIGNKLNATVLSNNKVRVSDGVFCVGGHVGRMEYADYQDMTIENGAAGYNRNDVIYAKFLTTGDVDTFQLLVKKGTATIGTAADPAFTKGNLYQGAAQRDYPLWRVKLTGLSITKVEQMFTVIPTIPELESRCNELNEKVGIKKLTNENLDEILTPGHYYAPGVNNIENKPDGVDAFGLDCIQAATGWFVHILYASNNMKKSYRRWIDINEGSTWTEWVEEKITDTTYSAGTGLSLSDKEFSVKYGTTTGTACKGNDSRLSDARKASDVYSWAKAANKPSYSWSEITGKPSSFTPTTHHHDERYRNVFAAVSTSTKKDLTTSGSYVPFTSFSNGAAGDYMTASSNGIKVLADGGYMIIATVSAYAGDYVFDLCIREFVSSTDYRDNSKLTYIGTKSEHIQFTHIVTAKENTVFRLLVSGDKAVTSGMDSARLQVVKLY